MTARRILHSLVEASAPDDSEDVGIREGLSAELGLTLALCPPVLVDAADPTADDDAGARGFCALRTDRRMTQACEDCLLSQLL
jgi:hypothetical protein